MAITLNGTTGITTPTYGGAVAAEYIAPVTSFKNRIINGAMQIDQRNAGASVAASLSSTYYIDRWRAERTAGGAYTIQQSTTAPSGFTNSLLITVTTADSSIAATDYYDVQQFIEGFNVADLGWGTASAQTITVSFWVRSSLTGTFAGSVSNSAANRSYVFTYNISSANTWEYKTITIAGDTSGTWLTNNGRGILLTFDLGNGSDYQATAGSWVSQYAVGTSSSVKVISTVGATWQVTGVQLEKGSTATSFDYRPYGTELTLCQRYFISTRTTSSLGSFSITGQALTTSRIIIGGAQFPVVMRADPTTTIYSVNADTSGAVALYNASTTPVGSGFAVSAPAAQGLWNRVDGSASLTIGSWYSFTYTASAEL